eukprot:m.245209 g.245209  ORF g.245209 m.245209 type:complete len:51 (+) comp26634_c5_seq22:571-723(+)
MWGAAAVVEALLEAGADVNATDKPLTPNLSCSFKPTLRTQTPLSTRSLCR